MKQRSVDWLLKMWVRLIIVVAFPILFISYLIE